MPTSTYPAVKTFSQGSVTVSSGSRTLDVVRVATATYRPSTTLHPPPTEYARVPMMIRASPAARIRPKSSSRNATRNAPASRRSIKIAEIIGCLRSGQKFSATVAARAEQLAGRTRGAFRKRRTVRAISIALTITAVCDREPGRVSAPRRMH